MEETAEEKLYKVIEKSIRYMVPHETIVGKIEAYKKEVLLDVIREIDTEKSEYTHNEAKTYNHGLNKAKLIIKTHLHK